jgi:hypothetical protein
MNKPLGVPWCLRALVAIFMSEKMRKKMKFKMIHHVDQETISEMYNNYAPVFILSTGRAGSKFLPGLLNLSTNISAYHEPSPTLEYFSNYAYHHQRDEAILVKMIDAARMELILQDYIKDKIYIESNQCLTFFAPALARLFKKSRFVHIVRHPGDFVRSAVRKGWHKNDSIWESGRLKMADEQQWAPMDQAERLAWLWNATNQFIENFKRTIEKERIAFFKLEDISTDVGVVKELLRFTGGKEIPADAIEKIQNTKVNELYIAPDEPPNMKKVANFPIYNEWDDALKEKLKRHTQALAVSYGYRI